LFAILFSVPTLAVLIYRGVRKIWPPRGQKRLRIASEFKRAGEIKKDVENHAQWDAVLESYGEYLIRDAERRLAETEETHSSATTPCSIAVLTDIHTEHLEFVLGAIGIKFIRRVADFWQFADENEEGSIKVETVCWLNYRDIVLIRWETNEYWEWPQ